LFKAIPDPNPNPGIESRDPGLNSIPIPIPIPEFKVDPAGACPPPPSQHHLPNVSI